MKLVYFNIRQVTQLTTLVEMKTFLFTSIHSSIGTQPAPFPCNSSLEYSLHANMIFIMQSTSIECFETCHSTMATYKPPFFFV